MALHGLVQLRIDFIGNRHDSWKQDAEVLLSDGTGTLLRAAWRLFSLSDSPGLSTKLPATFQSRSR